jgi:hypothetical protein
MSAAQGLAPETKPKISFDPTDEQTLVLKSLLATFFSEAMAENLNRLAHEPLPPMVSFLPLLRQVRVRDNLLRLDDIKGLTDSDIWEAFLTPEVEQALFGAMAETLRWRFKALSPMISVETLRTVQEVLQTLPSLPVPSTLQETATPASKSDEQLLTKLQAFSELQEIYRSTLQMAPEEIVRELSETLTDGLIGYMVGVSDRAVRGWISGKHSVRRADVTKLRVALTALRILLENIHPRVSLRWFANRNSILEDAPAELIQTGQQYDQVIRAATAYALDGA